MAIARLSASEADGAAFLVSAGIVYEIIAAACSSPQTAEINASSRSATLMKWVHVGIVQAAAFVALAAYFDRKRRMEYIAGGLTAGLLMYGSYVHANRSGLASGEPGTEGQGQSGSGSSGSSSKMLSWGNPT